MSRSLVPSPSASGRRGLHACGILASVTVAVAGPGCKGDKPRRSADGTYHALATCGLGYQADAWTVTDPDTLAQTWLPRIEPLVRAGTPAFHEARATFANDAVQVEVACSTWWSAAARLTVGGDAVSSETFAAFVDETQQRMRAGALATNHQRLDFQLAGGERLTLTVVSSGRGMIEDDQRPVITGFGGLVVGDRNVLVGFTGLEDEVDLADVESLLGTVTLPASR